MGNVIKVPQNANNQNKDKIKEKEAPADDELKKTKAYFFDESNSISNNSSDDEGNCIRINKPVKKEDEKSDDL